MNVWVQAYPMTPKWERKGNPRKKKKTIASLDQVALVTSRCPYRAFGRPFGVHLVRILSVSVSLSVTVFQMYFITKISYW